MQEQAFTLMNGDIIIVSCSEKLYNVLKKGPKIEISDCLDFCKLFLLIFHERGGHWNRKNVKDKRLIFLNSFKFEKKADFF